ncbi:hypothetical protein BDN71DRAFT_461575 [Pleurotus eryngii]|uniref:Uncharacterized protein n=1 Tax=Pleurotus eryngii TaxID=5323 RepID=A0A9P6D981_PLEER|nr:hypothetical protein BDN71DRAFT_461575 [Pleurotus eryngii]
MSIPLHNYSTIPISRLHAHSTAANAGPSSPAPARPTPPPSSTPPPFVSRSDHSPHHVIPRSLSLCHPTSPRLERLDDPSTALLTNYPTSLHSQSLPSSDSPPASFPKLIPSL